jgi:hypothetical protein
MTVNLLGIRQHGGSQQNAREGLGYQLRLAVGPGLVEALRVDVASLRVQVDDAIPKKYLPEVRERAVRTVLDHVDD